MNIPHGLAETIGRRRSMEDTHAIRELEEIGTFCAEVYDGHSGAEAAITAAELLTPLFLGLDDKGRDPHGPHPFSAEALRESYLATDRYIIGRGIESGAAAATLYIRETGFISANAGDCQIVAGEGPDAVTLTECHKPELPEERARIEAQGGIVVTLDVARVQGSLSMSRALGDVTLKPFITAEPRVVEGTFGRRNDIVIIACDGLWDTVSSEEALAAARKSRNAQEGADMLCTLAISKGSSDNITVIVLDLRRYAKHCSQERLHVSRVLDCAVEGLAGSIT